MNLPNGFKSPGNPIESRLQLQRGGPRQPSSNQTNNNLRVPQVQKPPLFPSLQSSQRANSSASGGPLSNRKKVRLAPGCSPLDWARLNSSGQNLRGIHPSEFPARVSKDVLKQHKSEDDCWTMLGGKVYNITPYVRFHPGGVEEIMKCAGKDGTSLFNKYHAWVNYERMLENCLVGFYIG